MKFALPFGREPNPRHKNRKKSKDGATTPQSMSLSELSKSFDVNEIIQIIEESKSASDRSVAILLSAYVERILEFLLTRCFPNHDESTIAKLKERDGALNTFFSKIYLAYAMSIIPDYIRNELEIIRRVRNVFAHSATRVDFSNEVISKECEKLDRIKVDAFLEAHPELINHSKARIRFVYTCQVITFALLLAALPKEFFNSPEVDEETKKKMIELSAMFGIKRTMPTA